MISKKGMTEKTGTKFENRSTDVIHFEIPPPKKKVDYEEKKKTISSGREWEEERENIWGNNGWKYPQFFFFFKKRIYKSKNVLCFWSMNSTKYKVQNIMYKAGKVQNIMARDYNRVKLLKT